MIRASRELLASREDVWKLVAEPYHLPDWWRAYTGVVPDRRGVAENARWKVVRSRKPGFVSRSGKEGLIVITRVVAGLELAWRDIDEGLDAAVELANAGPDRTRATVSVSGPWWRLHVEGARKLPKEGVARLYDLCQTAATL